MPPVIAGAVVAFSALAGVTGTALFVINVAVQLAVVAGASMAYSAHQKRKMKRAQAAAAAAAAVRTLMVRDSIAPWRYIYGQCKVSGSISFMETTGTTNEYLYLSIDLADREVEEIGDIYFDDELVPLDGSGNATGTFAGYARVQKFLGLAAGERNTTWETELPTLWTANHVGAGKARLMVRLKHNPDLFVNGLPTISAIVKGHKVYDLRTATTAWSANAALCTADFFNDEQLGRNVPYARIREAELEEAANVSDEDVVLSDTTTEKRYTINGTYDADQDVDGNIQDMVAAMAGTIADVGGEWVIHAGAWRTPTLTLDDSQLVGSFSVTPRQSRGDTFNGVKGVYISPINQWAPADFPPVKNDTYMGWDGGVRLWKDVVYNFTTSPATAQRLAKIELERGRQQIVVEGQYMLKAMQCQPGDVIQITRSRLGWEEKYFEVVSWQFIFFEQDGGAALKIALTVIETAEGVYDWNDGEETTVDLAPNTNFYNPRSVATPSGLSLTAEVEALSDGTVAPAIRVDWTAPADTRITSGGFVNIEYKKASASDWQVWDNRVSGALTFDRITGLETTEYDVRIRFENNSRVRGPYASASVTLDAVNLLSDFSNLCYNPTFDYGAAGWTINDAEFEMTDSAGVDGWGAVQIKSGEHALRNNYRVYVKNGENFHLRGRVKGTLAHVRVTCYDSAGTEIYYAYTQGAGSTTDFIQLDKLFTVPIGTNYIRAECVGWAIGDAFDNIQLMKLPPNVSYLDPETTVPQPQWSFDGTNVTIVSPDPLATVKYTVNAGSVNTYTAPFSASASDVIRAYAERSGYTTSTPLQTELS